MREDLWFKVRFDLLSRAHLLVQKNMVDFTEFVPIAKAKDMD